MDMRAWQIVRNGEPESALELGEASISPPGPGELNIRVIASGLALPDVLMCRGVYPMKPPMPFTPGLEFVGEVSAAGPDVSTPVGAKVMGVSTLIATGRGAFAEECRAMERTTYPVPAGMSDANAAGFTIAYHTAHVGLVRRARLQPGETVLVHGAAGGTGFAAVQLAKALGATVIATAGGPAKAQKCRELGADFAIDYAASDFVAEVMAATGGRGADIVYDPVGGEVFERSVECLAFEGRILPIGYASGRWGDIPPNQLAWRNASMVGVLPTGFPRSDMLAMHAHLARLYEEGAIRVLVDREISFDEIPAGLTVVAERRVQGRIVAVH
jgi:NADPH2:quinone reductase